MLTDENKGKIYVIFNGNDSRLRQSRILNFGSRLGGTGVNLEEVHEDFKSCIVNVNSCVKEDLHERMLFNNEGKHNYHFYQHVVEYYEEHA